MRLIPGAGVRSSPKDEESRTCPSRRRRRSAPNPRTGGSHAQRYTRVYTKPLADRWGVLADRRVFFSASRLEDQLGGQASSVACRRMASRSRMAPFWMDAVKRGNFRAEKAQDGVRRYRHPCPGESGQRPFPGRGTSASRRPRRPSLGSPQGVYGHLVSPVAGGLWQGGPSPAQTQIGAPWRTLACSASAPDLPAVLLGRDGEMLGGILGGQGAELDGELDDLLRLQLLQRIGKPPLRPVPLP